MKKKKIEKKDEAKIKGLGFNIIKKVKKMREKKLLPKRIAAA